MIDITDGDFQASISHDGKIFLRRKGTNLTGWITLAALEVNEALTIRTVLDRAVSLTPRVKLAQEQFDQKVKAITARKIAKTQDADNTAHAETCTARGVFDAELKAIQAYA